MTNFLLTNLILWNDLEFFRNKVNIVILDFRLRFLRWRLKKLREVNARSGRGQEAWK